MMYSTYANMGIPSFVLFFLLSCFPFFLLFYLPLLLPRLLTSQPTSLLTHSLSSLLSTFLIPFTHLFTPPFCPFFQLLFCALFHSPIRLLFLLCLRLTPNYLIDPSIPLLFSFYPFLLFFYSSILHHIGDLGIFCAPSNPPASKPYPPVSKSKRLVNVVSATVVDPEKGTGLGMASGVLCLVRALLLHELDRITAWGEDNVMIGVPELNRYLPHSRIQ